MTQTAKSVRGVTLSMQNLGYQIQDIAVMAQYGASPFLIFSTQISQLLGGPVGAMLGAFAAIAGGIALAASAADDAQESIEEMI
ncbi:phage tail length tape measure family protein, partial [Leadbetterella sp. DM7]|uniref:phage tail length tape measure family protein n=1 Tax=Leadbetterella sp. DM7 TaxID=3235085 RepID=UPI00349EBE0D